MKDFYREIFSKIKEPLAGLDASLYFLYSNPPARKLLRIEGDSRKICFLDFLSDEDKNKLLFHLKDKTLSSDIGELNLSLYLFKKSERCPLPISLTIFFNEKNSPVRYVFLISPLDVLEEEVKIKILQTVFNQSISSIVITDKDARIQYVNPAFTKITGYSPEEVIGENPRILKSGIQPQEYYEKMWQTLRAKEVWVGRFCNRRKDGSFYWEDAIIAPVLNENEEITNYLAIKNDITPFITLEEELKEKVILLDSIIKHIGIPIAFFKDTTIKKVSPAVQDLIGLSEEDLVGKSSRVFFESNAEYRYFIQHYYKRLLKERSISFEYKKRVADGSLRYFFVTANIIKNSSKEVESIWVGQDITPIKRLEMELRVAKEKAEKASQAKTEFLANFSHEIRTPLNGIIGSLEFLTSTSLNPEQLSFVNTAKSNAEMLLFLLNDILDISRIEHNRLDLEMIEFDLVLMLEEFFQSMKPLAKSKGIGFFLKVNPDVPRYVEGDPARIRQILSNLTSNALRFTSRGHVKIMAEKIREEDSHYLLRFRIKDTGIGIARDKLGLLFKRFSQVDTSIKRRFGGTGLGLAISKKLCEMMGGDIGVTSEEGKGSTFWFTLRLKKAKEGSNFKKISYSDKKRIKFEGKVLIVDDNPLNQEILKKLLENLGLEVDIAASGKEALFKIRNEEYHLIFMDVQMPDMDGMEVTRRLKRGDAGEKAQKIPIVAFTANAMKEELQRCFASGMDDYLVKPIFVDRLISILRKWLFYEETGERSREESLKEGARIFDIDGLLDRTLRDVDVSKKVLLTFLGASSELLQRLQKSLEAKNMKEVALLAHNLKGICANIGGEKVTEITEEIILAAKRGALEEVEILMEDIKEEIEFLYKEVRQWLKNSSSK